MTGIINYETFLLTGLLLNITPGNDTIFILSRSMAQGKRAGIMSVLGIATGSLIHTVLAAFGLSIIIAKSILAFNIIKYAGAAYLLYVGYKMLTDKTKINTDTSISENLINLKKIYRDGVLTNVLNPKVALFFISFLPQFINPHTTNTIVPFIKLGVTFTITGTIWCLILANFASVIFSKLNQNKKLSNYVNKTCGGVLIALGIKIALTTKK
ncbi:LysE family translocator [Flavobacterium hibernum]|uniref:Homoserine lactone transporter n=1 Tax=Flavobacterium hibernum TaxID=37752 RepID=A0A0D0F178_9FLAO|nr:LysE family translocator [Flavobacterium hibernum]KIO53351.1 homoserine lactone transporter [Flavobacterium hibernum]OXA87951.1 homoserine lactone transporter [Flavobacterium hibernum]STO10542.1 Homoserine/homoserine lactone efflux protein [Flavobacterium hibernum]